MDRADAQRLALEVAPIAAAVANFCDHIEHNEHADREWVLEAARHLRSLVEEVGQREDRPAILAYAERLGAIERRNVLSTPNSFDGRAAALSARTWRDLQLVQAQHDREYHADVTGLAKSEQLRHYALHLAKIVGALAEGLDGEDLLTRRLPDALIFGLKLSTVMGEALEEMPIQQAAGSGLAALTFLPSVEVGSRRA